MDKNISVWRGILYPPTHSHIWIKDDTGVIYHYKNREWVPLIQLANLESDGLMSKSDKYILNLLNENLRWN